MGKAPSQKRQFTINALFAVLALLISAFALFQMRSSLRLAERANEIAESANKPEIGSSWTLLPVETEVNRKPTVVMLAELRLSNRGGRPVTITSIGQPAGRPARSIHDRHQTETTLGLGLFRLQNSFQTYLHRINDALEEWPQSNRLPLPVDLELAPGAEKRLNLAFVAPLKEDLENPIEKLRFVVQISLSDGSVLQDELHYDRPAGR